MTCVIGVLLISFSMMGCNSFVDAGSERSPTAQEEKDIQYYADKGWKAIKEWWNAPQEKQIWSEVMGY